METTIVTSGLEVMSCCQCGVNFAAPQVLLADRRKNAGNIYCPNGHRLGWSETEADRLRKVIAVDRQRLAQEQHRREQIEADRTYWQTAHSMASRKLSAAKGRITRLRKRCVGGLCTCCDQHFADLEAHMKAKHPDAETLTD